MTEFILVLINRGPTGKPRLFVSMIRRFCLGLNGCVLSRLKISYWYRMTQKAELVQIQYNYYLTMITDSIRSHQTTILATASTLIILGYSTLVVTSPCLDHTHPLQRALQLYHSLGKANQIGRQVEYLLHAGTFNILVCLFVLAATCSRTVRVWKWTDFLGLLGSLMLIASNLVIALSIMSLMRGLEKVDLPKQFLIFLGGEWTWRGGQEELLGAMRVMMLWGMIVCVAASGCMAAHWKKRLTDAIETKLKRRNRMRMAQIQNGTPCRVSSQE